MQTHVSSRTIKHFKCLKNGAMNLILTSHSECLNASDTYKVEQFQGLRGKPMNFKIELNVKKYE